MVDYYPILARAMSAPEARDPQWRRGVYERAQQMLVTQLLARRPATSPDAIAAEQSGLDAAIRRIEAEMSRPARLGATPRQAPIDQADEDVADPSARAPDQGPLKTPLRLSSISLFAVASAAAAQSRNAQAGQRRRSRARHRRRRGRQRPGLRLSPPADVLSHLAAGR